MNKTQQPIVITETFNAPVEKVWKAITNLDEMKQWFFENIDHFEPRVGSESKFAVKSEGRTFTHLWKVTEVQVNKKLCCQWKFAEYTGTSMVCFELFEQGLKTQLKLTASVLEDFPENIPEFKRESGVAGWQYFINGRLKDFLL